MAFSLFLCVVSRDFFGNPFKIPAYDYGLHKGSLLLGTLYVANVGAGLIGLQLVNILRDLPEDLRMGRCYLPLEALQEAKLKVSDLLENPAKARPVFEHWLMQAEAWLEAGAAYTKGIRGRRLRFSVALPRLLGVETLALLRRHPPLETGHRLRVTRGTVLKCALKALLS
jgi:farnesyl-diphosphate farnesyltransferase